MVKSKCYFVKSPKTENRVVGSGSSPQEALKESIKKGTKEPIFLKVPPIDRSFVL